MEKRGQVTLLVILGLIILILASIAIFYADIIFLSQWERDRQASLVVPEEVQEPNDFIISCVAETVTEAMDILGTQGGYIELPTDPLPQSDANLFSNHLNVFPGSDLYVTYWFYETANNIQDSLVPTRDEMEQQLATYINENLGKCTKNFDLFSEYNMTAGAIDTEVEIKNDEVLFTIDYPLHVALDDFEYNFDTFYESSNAPLGELYEMATEIINNADNEYFLEERTLDLFTVNDDLPLSDVEFDCEPQVWSKTKVKETLQSYLDENIAQVKLVGTDYDLTNAENIYYEWEVLDSSRAGVKASVEYFTSWPMKMEVYPAQGDVMVSNPVIPDLPDGEGPAYVRAFFCLDSYNFVYDIKYPVLISLYDEDSDYVFQFAYQVIIDNNQPRENELGLLTTYEAETPICDDASQEVTVYVIAPREDATYEAVYGADVSYKCITQVCNLGMTESTALGVGLTTTVPGCYNGFMIAEKQGWYPGQTQFSSIDENEVYVALERYYDLDVEIKVVDENGNVRAPLSSESISIILTNTEQDYSVSVAYPQEGFDTISLIPGEYDVKAYLITDAVFDFTIDSYEIEQCASDTVKGLFSWFMSDTCTTLEVSSMTLDSVVSGGGEYKWDAERNDLMSASKITLYVNSYGIPATYDELNEVYNRLEEGTGIIYPLLE